MKYQEEKEEEFLVVSVYKWRRGFHQKDLMESIMNSLLKILSEKEFDCMVKLLLNHVIWVYG